MRLRSRTLAALLALFAFSASFAEQAWASMCATGEPAAAHSSTVAHPAAPHAHHTMPGMPGERHDGREPASPAGGCPVQAVAAGCTILSLPASTGHAPTAVPPANGVTPVRADQARELLLAVSLFRPPQR
ncbi:MAG TPA: hypothetical protein VFJ82_25370 [Longimicrobium sp.]|nr:hypothetical protein [Longimicrobium sp.]